MSQDPIQHIARLRLVPVIAIDNAEHAAPLADALCAGGLPCAEVTFRTEAAAEAMRVMAQCSDLLVGAGTVITPEQVDRAIDSGAHFIITPGVSPAVVEHCLQRQIPVVPGIATPSEIMQVLAFGLTTMKFFPAEASGGIPMLRALSAPFPQVRFIPTGGVSLNNLNDYLQLKSVLACGGSWLVASKLYADGDFSAVTKAVKEAVEGAAG